MNEVMAEYEGREVHAILDNLNTHKPKRDMWPKRHPNMGFHHTSTSASWLSQVEIWFSLPARHALAGAGFTHSKEVREQIDKFTEAHNEHAAAFQRTKADVRPRALTRKYPGLCSQVLGGIRC